LNERPGRADGSTRNAQLADEATRLIQLAGARDVQLRALGSVGVYMRTSRQAIFGKIARSPLKDIDLVASSEHRDRIRKTFEDAGYSVDEDMLWSSEGRRFAFARVVAGEQIDVDVFVDQLRMCHTLMLTPRLQIHPLTVSLADLVLQKLQIVELTREDRQDIGALLLEHPFGEEARDAIDIDYITGVLADDWGFCHTALMNLAKVRGGLSEANFDPPDRGVIDARAGELATAIENAPKTRKWRLRAKIGERKKWYDDVEEERAALL
jgi:hypothetical protein